MTKKEFLEQLEDALAGEVSNSVVYDNKQYYSQYINAELWKGRTEEEVLEELGNPRLLAKTIIDMQGGGFFSGPRETAYENYRTVEEEEKETEYFEKPFYRNSRFMGVFAGVIGILFVFLAIRLISGLAAMLIYYAWPVLLLLAMWIMVRHFFKK